VLAVKYFEEKLELNESTRRGKGTKHERAVKATVEEHCFMFSIGQKRRKERGRSIRLGQRCVKKVDGGIPGGRHAD